MEACGINHHFQNDMLCAYRASAVAQMMNATMSFRGRANRYLREIAQRNI